MSNAGLARCPACGGTIHPIASRCKHCKQDLAPMRDAERRQRRQDARAPSSPPAAEVAVPPTRARSVPPYPSSYPSSTWSRRWPYVAGAIALMAIGVSIGILLEQARKPPPQTSAKRSTVPSAVPDPMPEPALPQPMAPRRSVTPPAAPRSAGISDAGTFGVRLVESMCARLKQCGLVDQQLSAMCTALAPQLADPEAAARVSRGECRYDAGAADRCLRAIGSLSCAQPSDELSVWLRSAAQLSECTSAYDCL